MIRQVLKRQQAFYVEGFYIFQLVVTLKSFYLYSAILIENVYHIA